MFVAVPLILVTELDWSTGQHWKIYIPALMFSVVGMVPMVILSSRRGLVFSIFLAAILILLLSQLLLVWRVPGIAGLLMCLMVFFWGFNTLEALLPSLVSRIAPAGSKGAAIGIYNTFQFAGVFVGGVVSGWLYGAAGARSVFIFCTVLTAVWALVVAAAPKIRLHHSRVVKLPDGGDDWSRKLLSIAGVLEVTVVPEHSVAYLKLDTDQLVESELQDLIADRQ